MFVDCLPPAWPCAMEKCVTDGQPLGSRAVMSILAPLIKQIILIENEASLLRISKRTHLQFLLTIFKIHIYPEWGLNSYPSDEPCSFTCLIYPSTLDHCTTSDPMDVSARNNHLTKLIYVHNVFYLFLQE